MSETVNVVHDYLRRIDKEMTCDKKKKKQFLQRLQNDMEDFADSATTTLTENNLEKHFGTPQSIAENFLSTEPYNEVKRTFKHRKAVRVFVIATVVFALVCVLGYILFDKLARARIIRRICQNNNLRKCRRNATSRAGRHESLLRKEAKK